MWPGAFQLYSGKIFSGCVLEAGPLRRQGPPHICSSRQEALSKDIPALLDRHPWLCILTSGQSRRPAQLRLREVARLREGERSENTGMCSSNNDDNNSKPRMQRHGSIRFSMSSLQDEGSVPSPPESLAENHGRRGGRNPKLAKHHQSGIMSASVRSLRLSMRDNPILARKTRPPCPFSQKVGHMHRLPCVRQKESLQKCCWSGWLLSESR